MVGAPQDVHIYTLRKRQGKRRPWRCRWRVDGREYSRSFEQQERAKAWHASLVLANQRAERFDPATGEPVSWAQERVTVAEWAHRWVTQEWPTWSPHSRRDASRAMRVALPLLVSSQAPKLNAKAAKDLRVAIGRWLVPGSSDPMPAHLARHSLYLGELSPAVVKAADAGLVTKLDGTQVAATTARQRRTLVRQMLNAAVEAKLLNEQPWPTHNARRTSGKVVRQVEVKSLPTPAEARATISKLSGTPRLDAYRVLSSVVYLAGLRPSEARALEVADLTLPEEGWGAIDVTKAVADAGESYTSEEERVGLTKTGHARTVPAPPELVAILREWVGARSSGPLTQTRTGRAVSLARWEEAWAQVRPSSDLTLYDLRHAHATLALASGVPIGTVAKRLGHTPDVLLSTYAGALTGDDEVANARLQAALGE